jgi:pSer/pThr/pTyr-binding forkhead associated (FHA) protein
MDNHRPALSRGPEELPPGPQGTRFFAQVDLRQLADDADQTLDARVSVRKPVLESVSVGTGQQRFFIQSGRQTIGRAASSDIVVDSPSVSSTHAWITNQKGRCVIMNTLSTNGTFVNGKRVHKATLKHGDRVRLGQSEFLFLTRGSDAPGNGHLVGLAIGLVMVVAVAAMAWRFV